MSLPPTGRPVLHLSAALRVRGWTSPPDRPPAARHAGRIAGRDDRPAKGTRDQPGHRALDKPATERVRSRVLPAATTQTVGNSAPRCPAVLAADLGRNRRHRAARNDRRVQLHPTLTAWVRCGRCCPPTTPPPPTPGWTLSPVTWMPTTTWNDARRADILTDRRLGATCAPSGRPRSRFR